MEKIWNLINNADTCVLATSSDKKPRASILEYTVIDGKIIICTGSQSIKTKNIEKNNYVSLSIMKNYEYVTLDGILEDSSVDEIEKLLKVLEKRHPELLELEKSGKLDKFVYYTLKDVTAYYSDMTKGFLPPSIVKL